MVFETDPVLSPKEVSRLNPCCGGIWSLSPVKGLGLNSIKSCLNPCCGGIWSLSLIARTVGLQYSSVLILVVVGYGL